MNIYQARGLLNEIELCSTLVQIGICFGETL